MNGAGEVDEAAYRRLLQYFLRNKRFLERGAVCVNPEAGELFYLTRQERRRTLEIALEEVNGRVPVAAGVFGLTTKEIVESSRDMKDVGAQALFVFPPQGTIDVSTAWNADEYPEVWIDILKEQAAATDLPMIAHPLAGVSPAIFGQGISASATVKICEAVPNMIGWKMLYFYPGYRIVGLRLRALKKPVALMGAMAGFFHEYRAANLYDGSMSGYWNYAMEPMYEHLDAWDRKDIDAATKIWYDKLYDLHTLIFDRGRLHIRYKVATWLRGLIPTPFMRPPVPRPRQFEIDLIYSALQKAGFQVIDRKETEGVAIDSAKRASVAL